MGADVGVAGGATLAAGYDEPREGSVFGDDPELLELAGADAGDGGRRFLQRGDQPYRRTRRSHLPASVLVGGILLDGGVRDPISALFRAVEALDAELPALVREERVV